MRRTKGVILAGGSGTRLRPLTGVPDPQDISKTKKQIDNKHLLAVYNRQMIMHPILKLYKAGITDIMIITGGEKPGDFLELLGSGRDLWIGSEKISIELTFRYQDRAGGIAEALSLCENFVDNEKCVVMLGDNLIEDDITPFVDDFEQSKGKAKVLLKKVKDPEHFGVARLDDNTIVEIIEKPNKNDTPSEYAVVGCYFFDNQVWGILPNLKPSRRNELEITDVNNEYIRRGCLTYGILNGFWLDSGSSFEHLLKASMWTAQKDSVDIKAIMDDINFDYK